MSDGIDKLAGAIGDTLKTAPTLYEDALQPTVQEVGKFAARIPRAINAAFSGLDKWILNREYTIDETKKLLTKKLENVDPEKIITPEPYVAIPAIQAISYSMDSEKLQNLYANLLAKAMNIDTKDFVHPAFVEIIKQLSPIDVHVLEEISSKGFIQVVNIYCAKYLNKNVNQRIQLMENPIEKRGFEGLTHIVDFHPDIVKISIDNLLRLRLIEERFRLNAPISAEIQSSPFYISISQQIKQLAIDDTWEYEEVSQSYYLTDLGKSFRNICIE